MVEQAHADRGRSRIRQATGLSKVSSCARSHAAIARQVYPSLSITVAGLAKCVVMAFTLSCYYLDEPLSGDELQFAMRTLIGPWATFRTGANALVQKRVPAVLPTPDESGHYPESRELRAERVRANLRHAGIRSDAGRQILWVMPRDSEWDAIFQFAIRLETGFAPFVAQRWFEEQGVLARGRLRVIDTQMLLRGL